MTSENPLATELLELALAISTQAGNLLMARPENFDLNQKSSARDFATHMDHASEKLIVESILAARPDDGIIGEEGSDRPSKSGITWVIDPIDGTVNYFYGLPGWNVSIAAKDSEGVLVGVVNAPTLSAQWHAVRAGGAFLNGKPIRCNEPVEMQEALLGTGFSYNSEQRERQAQFFLEIVADIRDIRRTGGAAVDLCCVATGWTDGYFERDLHEWDLAAGGLIAREAGAVVSGRNGGEAGFEMTICAGPTLHAALAARIG
jgi:myo-inositol-1(or 4)-monophosphatase